MKRFVLSLILVIIMTGCEVNNSPEAQFAESISTIEFLPTKTSSSTSQATSPPLERTIETEETTVATQGNLKYKPTSTAPANPDATPSSISSVKTFSKPVPTLKPGEWEKLPVIPRIGEHVVEIYQRGLEKGNDPHAFSKVGDCGSTPSWFLGDFDRGQRFYELGEYQQLSEVIDEFKGSFGRTSLAARSGFNASSLFVPIWADREFCEEDETPLACEYRNQRPIIAFVMLGANDVWHPDEFDPQMRKIIEFLIDNGVVPILSTKADNQEGDGSINATIANLALEYEIPLLNYWLAVQPLPTKGLVEDGVHLTFGRNFFDDPVAMNKAWPVRNLTALQTLDAVWRKATGVGK